MSFALSELSDDCVGTPSITNSGSLVELIDPMPRMRIVPIPEGLPSAVMVMPGMRPCSARIGSVSGRAFISATLTMLMAPVRSALRWVL